MFSLTPFFVKHEFRDKKIVFIHHIYFLHKKSHNTDLGKIRTVIFILNIYVKDF